MAVHPHARAVAGRGECAARAHSGQDVRQGAHRAWDENRLPGVAQAGGQIRMAGRQCPGRSLPVHAQPGRNAADLMGFQRGQIVGHVIDQVQRRARRGQAAGGLGEQLAVRPGVVGGGGHGAQVVAAFRRSDRGTGQLPVGHADAGAGHRGVHDLHVVSADLVSQPAGSAVDHDADLCGHHYHASEIALLAAGATVHDETRIMSPAGEEPVLTYPAVRAS